MFVRSVGFRGSLSGALLGIEECGSGLFGEVLGTNFLVWLCWTRWLSGLLDQSGLGIYYRYRYFLCNRICI